MATKVRCPKCDGKGYTFDHAEVDDPDDWAWCSVCFASGEVDELGAMIHELAEMSEDF